MAKVWPIPSLLSIIFCKSLNPCTNRATTNPAACYPAHLERAGIYQQTLARDPDPGGLAWYVGKLEAGDTTLQRITLDVLYSAVTAPDSTTVANKGEVADYYTAKVAAGCQYDKGVSI
jgi:hypothetical protein